MSVEAAKTKFEAARKAVDDGMAKKARLEERLGELQLKQSEISIADIKKERQRVVEAVALGAISDNEYKKSIEKLGKVELEYSALTEQIEVVKDAMSDTGDLLSKLQQGINEASRCLYLAIAEKLKEEIKLKMPVHDLQLLSVCKVRSGQHWGVEGWHNMVDDLTGGGRVDTSVTQALESDLKKQYGF